MTDRSDPVAVVRELAAGVSRLVSGRLDAAAREAELDRVVAMYAKETDLRQPHDPRGFRRLRTHGELREYFAAQPHLAPEDEPVDPADGEIYRTDDPEVVVYELLWSGTVHGRPLDVTSLIVLRVRDGLIIESLDYTDRLSVDQLFEELNTGTV